MKLRAKTAVLCARGIRFGLQRVLHRAASQLPGRVALKLDPQLISELAKNLSEGSIVVCGTNGKTTTNNLIAACAESAGKSVICNREGANMAPGVAAALLTKKRAQWAVIEADELSCKQIIPALKPKILVLLNLFRDQLDRAGEIDHIQDTLIKALRQSPDTSLLVCADDPLSCLVARRVQESGSEVLSFSLTGELKLAADRVAEARFCQLCGAPLKYARHLYAQLGQFSCPDCDFASFQPDFCASRISLGREQLSFEVEDLRASADGRETATRAAQVAGASAAEVTRTADTATATHATEATHTTVPACAYKQQIRADFGGAYMVYNLLAVFAATRLMGLEVDFSQVLAGFHPKNGRLQKFHLDGREIILNLAKNPAGFNQNISLMLADPRDKQVCFVINDNDNDGRDISWIWDVDFERLAQEKQLGVFASGLRAHDVAVRMKYAGMSAPLVDSVQELLSQIKSKDPSCPLYVLTNYSALWPAKAELEALQAQKNR